MTKRSYNVASVDKAFAIIDYIARHGGATYKELCDETEFTVTSVYTILRTCLTNGVLKLGADKKYRLGTKLLYWGYSAEQRIEIAALAEPTMKKLAKELQVSVHLGQMIGGKAILVKKVDGNYYTIKTVVIGQEVLFHCQSTGKALLAFQPTEVQEEIVNSIEYTAYTKTTITTPEEMREDLARIRERGYACDLHESNDSATGFGVPIFNWNNQLVASLSIGYMGPELTEAQKTLFIEKLRDASRDISAVVGNAVPE